MSSPVLGTENKNEKQGRQKPCPHEASILVADTHIHTQLDIYMYIYMHTYIYTYIHIYQKLCLHNTQQRNKVQEWKTWKLHTIHFLI